MLQNAWFQLDVRDDGLYIILYPPADGGQELSFFELNLYLIKNKIILKQAEKETLKQALEGPTQKKEVKLRESGVMPVDESIAVTMAADKMSAVARVYAPSAEGRPISDKEDFLARLDGAGLKFGINEEVVEDWFTDKRYCTDLYIADGSPAEESRDAFIEYTFNVGGEFRPTIDENDNIDFHRLNQINHVAEGEILAVLTPAYEGVNGKNVLGLDILPKKPVRLTLSPGSNTELSEDGNVLTATTAGHVEMLRGKINVNNIYTVKGNVDAGTGDIEYDGSVKIAGDVMAGYAVIATGDIYVDGVVEAAFLNAGGQIVLTKGMHGDAKGSLKAGGNIAARFIQACTVESGGDITSGSILHSKVTAKNSIVVSSKRGVISGGEFKAGTLISAVAVGSPAKTNTQLEIGPDSALLDQYLNLENILVEKRLAQRRDKQTFDIAKRRLDGADPLPPDKAQYLEAIQNQLATIETEINELTIRYNQLKDEVDKSDPGRIVVKGEVYEGTRIVISDVAYYVRNILSHCQFLVDGNEIKTIAL